MTRCASDSLDLNAALLPVHDNTTGLSRTETLYFNYVLLPTQPDRKRQNLIAMLFRFFFLFDGQPFWFLIDEGFPRMIWLCHHATC